jgi:hypothetical protein
MSTFRPFGSGPTRRGVLAGVLSASIILDPEVVSAGGGPLLPEALVRDRRGSYGMYSFPGPMDVLDAPVVIDHDSTRFLAVSPRTSEPVIPIIFSHGAFSEPQLYFRVFRHLASHGFVVVAPQHDDSLFERGGVARRVAQDGRTYWDFGRVLGDVTAWRSRVRALSSGIEVIDTVARAARLAVDPAIRIVVGQTFGAFAAMLAMGCVSESVSGPVAIPEPRFTAGVFITPPGVGSLGLTQSSFSAMRSPALVLTGDARDPDPTGQDAERRQDPHRLSAPGFRHLAVLERATASTWSGQRLTAGSPEDVLFLDQLAVMTAFGHAYGHYRQEALNDLTGGLFDRVTQGRVRTQWR